MFKNLSDDEKKFTYFWIVVFASAIGFWVITLHWVWHLIIS